jgi:hypothetical protein
MDFGGLFGAAGQIAGAFIAGDAARKATALQSAAIGQIQQNITSGMNPEQVQQLATQADFQRAQNQQKLLGQLFPGLASAEQTAAQGIAQQAGGFGAGSPSTAIAQQAAQDAIKNAGATQQGQNQLIDAALSQLKAGATLPPDVEAQLVQAGLESSGMTTQSASGQGIGGQQLRTILGTAGIQLQQQRQQQAAQLLTSAQNLEQSRQNILQSLFPNLSAVQLQQLQGSGTAFGIGANATPQAGLGGSQIANVWLNRVGALNQAIGQQAGVQAAGQLAQGAIWGNAIGSAVSGIGSVGLGGGGKQVNNNAGLSMDLYGRGL